MAESLSTGKNRVLCRYYMNGVCRDGSQCSFSHDRSDRPNNICRYYLSGHCSYGDRCRYEHNKPKVSCRTCPTNNRLSIKSNGLRNSNCGFTEPVSMKPALVSPCKELPHSRMVTLRKQNQKSSDSGLGEEPCSPKLSLSVPKSPDQWVKAAEFVPGQPYRAGPTYAVAAKSGIANDLDNFRIHTSDDVTVSKDLLCPYLIHGECPYGDDCDYTHGEICDMCGFPMLHPNNTEQQKRHREECLQLMEKDMELSFWIAQSKDKVCGICMDIVLEKDPPSEQRFGILPNCTHVFCLPCIRQWRAAKQFENKIIRSCPECRTLSDFVTPSKYWVETREEKMQLIEGYKQALSSKPCRYFDQGRGECPFNEKCFYRHAYPDGRKADPLPQRPRRRRNAEGDLDTLQQIILWDFLEEHENRVLIDLQLAEEILLAEGLRFWEGLDLSGYESEDSDFEDMLLL